MEANLSSVFKFSRFVGLFPFDGRFQWSWKIFIYCVFIQLLNVPSMINGFIIHYNEIIIEYRLRSLSVLVILNWISNFLSFITGIFTVLHLTRKRKLVFQLLDNINKEILECRQRPKTRLIAIYIDLFLATLMIILWMCFAGRGHGLTNISFSLMAWLLTTSGISITGQLWDLMSMMNLSLCETSKRYDESSISALERMTTYGEYINEIYGPFLFIMMVKPFFELIFFSYSLLLPVFSFLFDIRVNILLLFFILFSFVRLAMIVYSCRSFLNQVMLLLFIFKNTKVYRILIKLIIISWLILNNSS